MPNYKISLAYDGRRYKGWRKTKEDGDKTIQGKLEAILGKLYKEEVELIGAVSTDAGVHAYKQVANFQAPNDAYNALAIKNYFEEYLPEDIIIKSVELVEDRFQSRYNVEKITYEYRIWKLDAKERPLFERSYVNPIDQKLDFNLMQQGAVKFKGEHDFLAFSPKTKKGNTIKNIFDVFMEQNENEIVIRMVANGYLLNMERVMVGTLIQIGLGQKKPDTIDKAFQTGGSDYAGHKVMSHALFLKDVEF